MPSYGGPGSCLGEAELWGSKTVGRTPSTHRLRFFYNQLDTPLGYT